MAFYEHLCSLTSTLCTEASGSLLAFPLLKTSSGSKYTLRVSKLFTMGCKFPLRSGPTELCSISWLPHSHGLADVSLVITGNQILPWALCLISSTHKGCHLIFAPLGPSPHVSVFPDLSIKADVSRSRPVMFNRGPSGTCSFQAFDMDPDHWCNMGYLFFSWNKRYQCMSCDF